MWAGLGYYRRARFLLEVVSHLNIVFHHSPLCILFSLQGLSETYFFYCTQQVFLITYWTLFEFLMANKGVEPSSLICSAYLVKTDKK